MENALSESEEMVLSTTAGNLPLNEYCLRDGGGEWRVLHVGALFSRNEESEYLMSPGDSLPYGVTLWASSIALAHDLASRPRLNGSKVLELGSGTGLPGIVAASRGARLVQTDKNPVAMALAKRNVLRNNLADVDQRLSDWTKWDDDDKYGLIIGSDILYSGEMHPHLCSIFERNLAAGGRVLISDPFRAASVRLLESLEQNGWSVKMSKWSVQNGNSSRPVGVFELQPPRAS